MSSVPSVIHKMRKRKKNTKKRVKSGIRTAATAGNLAYVMRPDEASGEGRERDGMASGR